MADFTAAHQAWTRQRSDVWFGDGPMPDIVARRLAEPVLEWLKLTGLYSEERDKVVCEAARSVARMATSYGYRHPTLAKDPACADARRRYEC
jgi:hypothetical protein